MIISNCRGGTFKKKLPADFLNAYNTVNVMNTESVLEKVVQ